MGIAAVPSPRLQRSTTGPVGDADKVLRILTGWRAAEFRGYAVAERRADRRLVVVSLLTALEAQGIPVTCLLIAADDTAAEQWRDHLRDGTTAASDWSVRTADDLLGDGTRLDNGVVVVADEVESYLDESFIGTISGARATLGLCATSTGLGGTSLRRFIGRPLDTGRAAEALDLAPLGARAPSAPDGGQGEDPDDAREQLVAVADPSDLLGLYLRQIQKIPLLSAAEEIELARQIEAGVLAEAALAEGPASTRAVTGSRRDLHHRWSAAMDRDLSALVELGQAAKERFLVSNLRLVYWVARRYSKRMDIMDAIQEGSLGLVRAVEKYDHTTGNKFSTYATWWVRQAITRAIADQARTIRMPVHMVEQINKATRVQREMLQELGREPTPEELATELDMTPKKVVEMQGYAHEPFSLDEIVEAGIDVEETFSSDPCEPTVAALLRDDIEAALWKLSEREAAVIRMRFGFCDGEIKTLDEIGRAFGLTRERIRQIESKTLSKLRHPARSGAMREYFGGEVDPELKSTA